MTSFGPCSRLHLVGKGLVAIVVFWPARNFLEPTYSNADTFLLLPDLLYLTIAATFNEMQSELTIWFLTLEVLGLLHQWLSWDT